MIWIAMLRMLRLMTNEGAAVAGPAGRLLLFNIEGNTGRGTFQVHRNKRRSAVIKTLLLQQASK